MAGIAHLNDGGGDEDGRLAARKGGQRGSLLVAAQPSVQETHPGAAQQTLLLHTQTLPSRYLVMFDPSLTLLLYSALRQGRKPITRRA